MSQKAKIPGCSSVDCLGSLGLMGEKQAGEKPDDFATLFLHLTPEMQRKSLRW